MNELLTRIWAIVSTLFWLPTNRVGQLARVESWQVAYARDGLTFSRDKDDLDQLRGLTESGLLSAFGKTQAKAHRITTKGIFHALALQNIPLDAMREMLAQISSVQKLSRITLPNTKTRLAMGFEFVPSAGPWWETALKTDKAFKGYGIDQNGFQNDYYLAMMSIGWMRQYHASNGIIWAVVVTPEGEAALNNWPDVGDLPAHDHRASEIWKAGCAFAIRFFETTQPPAWTRRVMARHLPASRWQ